MNTNKMNKNPKMQNDDDIHNTLTVLESATGMLLSQYGNTTYKEWCLNEIRRTKKAGARVTLFELGNRCCIRRIT